MAKKKLGYISKMDLVRLYLTLVKEDIKTKFKKVKVFLSECNWKCKL